MRRCLGLLIAVAALTGCQRAPVKPAPQIVHVPITRYVPIPRELTAPVPIEEPATRTVAEAVRVARARKAALQQANAQLKAIRDLGDPPTTGD